MKAFYLEQDGYGDNFFVVAKNERDALSCIAKHCNDDRDIDARFLMEIKDGKVPRGYRIREIKKCEVVEVEIS